MRWLVELRNTSGHTRLLTDILCQLSLEVIEQDGGSFLCGKALEGCYSSQEAYALSKKVECILSESASRPPYAEVSIAIGSKVLDLSVAEPTRTNIFLQVTSCSQLNFSSSGAVSITFPEEIMEKERTKREQEQREKEYQELLKLVSVAIRSAFADKNALTVQRLLAGALEPLQLGHIADLIENDLGGKRTDFASNVEWKRFYRSINHPTIFGQSARHIVSPHEPPPNPMNLIQATTFIKRTANAWLERKAQLNG